MVSEKVCAWLMDNADAPIRYRVARELLQDDKTAKKIESTLLENAAVQLWLRNLTPEIRPYCRPALESCHGAEDGSLENALTKAVRLGLHGALLQTADIKDYYFDRFKKSFTYRPFRGRHSCLGLVITANMLCMAGIQDETMTAYLLGSLEEMHRFVRQKNYDIYYSPDDEERAELSVPTTLRMWEDSGAVIKPEPSNDNCFCYPLIYDLFGLYQLYGRHGPETDDKINAVIDYISCDDFHNKIVKGYGIIKTSGKPEFYGLAWSPHYPGWSDVASYMKQSDACIAFNGAHTDRPFVPKLLFFAELITNYPAALETKWFADLLQVLGQYKTDNETYEFPREWLAEKHGYSVGGFHMSFGENRRKKNWAEIESTFYMQLLLKKHFPQVKSSEAISISL